MGTKGLHPKESCLLQENGAELYPLNNKSLEEFQRLLDYLGEEECPEDFCGNEGFYVTYYKGYEAELWLVQDVFFDVRINIFKTDDDDFLEVYAEDTSLDSDSDFEEILEEMIAAIESVAELDYHS